MSAPKYLIDTNVFIGLEDNAEVAPNFSALLQLTGRFGVGVFVHAAALDDIRRDRDHERRRISLSKIEKFPRIEKVIGLLPDQLEAAYGTIRKANDLVDATLLHALESGVADFLVTQDQGLHDRARRRSPALGDRVLYVADAVSLLRTTYEPIEVSLPAIQEVDAHRIPDSDPIFASLRSDYPEFDNWWKEKCVKPMRKCWIVTDNDQIAGLVVRKDESPSDTDAKSPGDKFLKICTFKVRPESRGIKLGELLLKQILWYAQTNRYTVVYLTAFEKQETLIGLLEFYGFIHTADNSNGERIYEKILSRDRLVEIDQSKLFEIARINYPRFSAGPTVPAYVIPIRESYHEILFPELVDSSQYQLFSAPFGMELRKPGNTIRKVYICRAQAQMRISGSILFFYKSLSFRRPSQAVTTIGILEEMTLARSLQDLRRIVGGRSVYSDAQLIEMQPTARRPVKVINFLLVGHIEPEINLSTLCANGVFSGRPPQSIKRLSFAQQSEMLRHVNLGFDL